MTFRAERFHWGDDVEFDWHPPVETKEWDEGKHPRVPAGSHGGGQFAGGGGGSGGVLATADAKAALEKSREVAKEVGYDPKLVVVKPAAHKFKLMGEMHTAAAVSTVTGKNKGRIEVYPDQIKADLKELPGIIAHEVEHQKFQAALDDAEHNEKSPVNEALFAVDPEDFAAADGVSDYSRAYWEDWLVGKADIPTTFHETLAEMARAKYETGEFPKHQGGKPSDAKVWRNLFEAVDEAYKALSKK